MTLIRYLIVGIINTIVGFGVIFLLMYAGIIPEISNLIGYIVGIIVSYHLNRLYTFKRSMKGKKIFVKFWFSMLIAYLANILVLIILHRYNSVNPYYSQIIAGTVYTFIGYLLSKFFVFR